MIVVLVLYFAPATGNNPAPKPIPATVPFFPLEVVTWEAEPKSASPAAKLFIVPLPFKSCADAFG